MQIDEFLELVRKRRSIRRFKPDPIPDEDVEKILEAARWAMSGANGQPWEFIVVKNRETITKIAELARDGMMESYSLEQTRIPELRHPNFASHPPGGLPSWKDAPVVIVVVGDRRAFQASVLASNFLSGEAGPSATYLHAMGNANHNLHLAAATLGLGAQWVTVTRAWEEALKRLLDVPDILGIRTIVPLGHPAYKPKPPYRRELAEITHSEKYDRSKYRTMADVVQFIYKLRGRTKPLYDQ